VKLARLTSIAAAALLTACGAATSPGDPPPFEIEPSVVIPSASGRLSISLWTAPSPPVKGVNALRVSLADSAGAPVAASDVTAVAWMPAHGHGTAVKSEFEDVGGGAYEATHVVFFMDGRWEVRGELKEAAAAQGSLADSFVATFDVR
jgi:hypothetical protein